MRPSAYHWWDAAVNKTRGSYNIYQEITIPQSVSHKWDMLAPAGFTYQDTGWNVLFIIFKFHHYSVEQFIFKSFTARR